MSSTHTTRRAKADNNLRVHDIRRDIGIRDVLAKLATEFRLDLLEVDRSQSNTGTSVNLGFVTDDLAAKGLGESADRLAKVPLEELDNRRREVKLVCTVQNVLL